MVMADWIETLHEFDIKHLFKEATDSKDSMVEYQSKFKRCNSI